MHSPLLGLPDVLIDSVLDTKFESSGGNDARSTLKRKEKNKGNKQKLLLKHILLHFLCHMKISTCSNHLNGIGKTCIIQCKCIMYKLFHNHHILIVLRSQYMVVTDISFEQKKSKYCI